MSSGRPLVTLISPLTADEPDGAGRACSVPPLGVLNLAAVLKTNHIDTQVIDLNLHWTRSGGSSAKLFANTIGAVRTSRPCLLGLSTICSSYPLTLRLARRLKQHFPSTPIVLGGPQASVVDIATLTAFPFVDFVLRGEAEETFPCFVKTLLNNGSTDRQPGLTFRIGSALHRNPDAPPVLDLDSLPLPSFDGYTGVSQWPSLPLEVGRGCPFSCRFCSTNDFFRRRYRFKSTNHVFRQMAFLKRQCGIAAFNLIHDMFTADKRRIVDFCRGLLALGAPYTWTCSARTDTVDNELLRLMRAAGCTGIFFGIETGSARLQRVIRKHLDLQRARAVLAECDRLRIDTTASLIIGYPDETATDLSATLSFFRDAARLDRADGQLHVLAPLAGTALETEYRSQLMFDRGGGEISEFGVAQGKADRILIESYPDIFSNFYAFPNRLPAPELATICEFFVTLQERCKGLLISLVDGPTKPLELFDRWTRYGSGHGKSTTYYRQMTFLDDFLAFVKASYVGRGCVAVDVMWRFYSEVKVAGTAPNRRTTRPETQGPRKRTKSILRISPDVRVVSVRGDVVGVFDCLRRRKKPGSDCADRETTVSVRKAENGRFLVSEVPPLTATILASLDGSVEDVLRTLTAKGVTWDNLVAAQFIPEALRILERDGLVSCATVGRR